MVPRERGTSEQHRRRDDSWESSLMPAGRNSGEPGQRGIKALQVILRVPTQSGWETVPRWLYVLRSTWKPSFPSHP